MSITTDKSSKVSRRVIGRRMGLLCGSAVAAFASPAMAQDQESAAKASSKEAEAIGEVLETIVVTGYRASIEMSLDQKREANAIVEVITAEDISKFPDKNVADALQRVPGVVISRDGGEGKSVSVRGLQPGLTLSLLNGNYIATSETNNEPSRSFNYVLLPANMLSQAELYKTSEARLEEGGVGGTVILNTRRPLDMEPWEGFVNVEGTYSDTTEKVEPQLSGMVSWRNEDETFGVLVGATWQKRTNRSMGASTESWLWYSDGNKQPAVDVNGNALDPQPAKWWGRSGFNDQRGNHYSDFFMPTSVNFGILNQKRERLGIQATAQARPTDNLTFTTNYFRFDLKGDYSFNELKIPEWNLARIMSDGNYAGGRLLNGLKFDPSKTIVTGAAYEKLANKAYYCSGKEAAAAGLKPNGFGADDCTVPTPQITGNFSREKALSQTLDAGFEWEGDSWDVAVRAGTTWSSGGPSMNFKVAAKPRRFVNGAWQSGNLFSSWDLSGKPTATFSSNLQEQLKAGIAEMDIGSTNSSWLKTSVTQDFIQADVAKLFDNSFMKSLQFGMKFRNGSVHRNTGNTYWVCKGRDPKNYDNRYQQCDPNAGIARPEFFLAKPIGNITGGFAASVFPGIDFDAYLKHLNNTYGDAQRRDEPNFVYDVNERALAGYMQANFESNRLRGNIGVRVVRTRQSATSTDKLRNFIDYYVDDPATGKPATCPASGKYLTYTCKPGQLIAPWGSQGLIKESYVTARLDKTYTDFLPSMNVSYEITDDVLLRGAIAKVIARPAFTSIASPGALDYVSKEFADDRLAFGGRAEGWYGSGSNKDLKPFEAWQYDLGLEWYFDRGSVIGLGLFRKDVKNFVVPITVDQQQVINGQTVTVRNFSTNANGRDGVSQGVEIYAQHTFDIGIGFQTNFTYNDTNLAAITLNGVDLGKSPLVGSAKTQFNATVFYEDNGVLLRASYNRRGQVVGGKTNGHTIYTEPYQQVDLNAAYDITDNFVITASVLNLTKEEYRSHLGNDTKARFYSGGYSGRIFYAGATYKF